MIMRIFNKLICTQENISTDQPERQPMSRPGRPMALNAKIAYLKLGNELIIRDAFDILAAFVIIFRTLWIFLYPPS